MAGSKNVVPITQQNHLQQWRPRRGSSSLILASCSLLFLSLLVLFFHPLTATAFTSNSSTTAINIKIISLSSRSTTASHDLRDSRNDAVSRTPNSLNELNSCDVFIGSWVVDRAGPVYPPGSCPDVDDAFNCFRNGRRDNNYLYYRWKPRGCEIPRFDGGRLLSLLRNKRVVFVGDSLNRNMWQSLICSLRHHSQPINSSSLLQVSDSIHFSYLFKEYNCTIEYIKSPFLVQRRRLGGFQGQRRETLRLDMMQETPSYVSADVLVFNTGHWWTSHKTNKGIGYFQEGDHVHRKLKVEQAFKRALGTWARYVDILVENGSLVFFSGYSVSHFRGGKWNSGGGCDRETQPGQGQVLSSAYPKWMMKELEEMMGKMKKSVTYLNITRMTEERRDAHPSIFRRPMQPGGRGGDVVAVQDCSHWCLPGVPDSWNHLFYAYLLFMLPVLDLAWSSFFIWNRFPESNIY